MEPINDNGPRPDEFYELPKTRRHRLLPTVIASFVAGMLFMSLLMFATGSGFARSRRNFEPVARNDIQITNISSVPIGQLQRVRGSGPKVPIDGISQIIVSAYRGNTNIIIHDEDYIWMDASGGLDYHFTDNGQTLFIGTSRSSVDIFVPHSYQTAVLDKLDIFSHRGNISIVGMDGSNTAIAGDLLVNNYRGYINLSNLSVSSELTLRTYRADISLYNVLSNPHATVLNTYRGSVSAN